MTNLLIPCVSSTCSILPISHTELLGFWTLSILRSLVSGVYIASVSDMGV
jgi:hypothetical protein